ncbi:hypothetical protein TWF679_003498 [Orbilia oligospora]|uniref:Uncharacterized protein n=1 Tax=Orbilia oligospora TaxID=2813651 RepID=A0A8H8URH0_ORBOL|nr:hypothetical protein TWF679_003498 [Orbilia oligospora]
MIGDIIATVDILIRLGSEIKKRCEYLGQAPEDLELVNIRLGILKSSFSEDNEKDDIWKNNQIVFATILDLLKGIENSWKECAKALGLDTASAEIITKKTNALGKRLKQFQTFFSVPERITEIRRMAERLEHVCTILTTFTALYNSRMQQQRTGIGGDVGSKAVLKSIFVSKDSLDLDFKTDFPGIDQMIGNLLEECKDLRRRLQEATLIPDTSTVQAYQNHNPEGVSFWKDRFQNGGLGPSALRYEGSRYCIDKSGTRLLSTIRPLWLPALRSALDPLHKGYVKPQDFFQFLHDSSLSHKLRSLTLENAGYGILVECERATGDLPLPEIESPLDHVGWTCGQIVAVPTPAELGIFAEREVMEASTESLFDYFSNTAQDVDIYVRYLQTGQIERKSLLRQIRPISGISVGAVVSIRHELEPGIYAWSSDFHITEFKACYGGKYIITAGTGLNAVVFCTRPFKTSSEMLPDDNSFTSSIPEFDFKLLGPSRAFNHPPKVGEKIQSESEGESDENDIGGFTEEQFTKFGKGTRRLWRTWLRDIRSYDVRPYHCFHIGDSIEAPVMYPDFRFHYHTIDKSQLYLPARIVDVQGDQYRVEFNPALSAHRWWPGRMSKGQQVDLIPGSHSKVENPFDFNTVMIAMDRIRPFSGGPRPALGVQSAKPFGWNSFQGVHLSKIENLLEKTLWNDDHDNRARM